MDQRIEILLDGKLLGNFSFRKGFSIEKNIALGKHTITAIGIFQLAKISEEQSFELNENEPTILNVTYSRTWGKFGEFEISSINSRLAKLYEKKWPKQKLSILWGIEIACIIFIIYFAYWWHISDYYTGWQDECSGGYYRGDMEKYSDKDCQEHVNEYYDKNFTLHEVTTMIWRRDNWMVLIIYSILFPTAIFGGIREAKSHVNDINKEIERLELYNYNRKKEKIEEERRIEANKAERQRVWLAEKEEIGEKIKMADNLGNKGGLENLKKALNIYSKYGNGSRKIEIEIAKEKEKYLDYESALLDYENLGLHKSARRVRQKINDQKEIKVDQTVIHGDYVDDRDTIVKDSVINRSNIGPDGKSKAEELREAKSLFKEGLIDHDEFKQMKKEILGK